MAVHQSPSSPEIVGKLFHCCHYCLVAPPVDDNDDSCDDGDHDDGDDGRDDDGGNI